jgi:hypothetical protein
MAGTLHVPFHRGFVKGVGVPFYDADCILGTVSKAGSQSIAEIVGGKDCLAVFDSDGSLGAGGDAEAAAVTFVLVYLNDFTQHGKTPWC